MPDVKTGVLTIRQAAKEYHLPEYAIRTMVKQKRFEVLQFGRRVYIMRHIFEEYLKSGGAVYDASKASGN